MGLRQWEQVCVCVGGGETTLKREGHQEEEGLIHSTRMKRGCLRNHEQVGAAVVNSEMRPMDWIKWFSPV